MEVVVEGVAAVDELVEHDAQRPNVALVVVLEVVVVHLEEYFGRHGGRCAALHRVDEGLLAFRYLTFEIYRGS